MKPCFKSWKLRWFVCVLHLGLFTLFSSIHHRLKCPFFFGRLPSGNQTWHWKIQHLPMNFRWNTTSSLYSWVGHHVYMKDWRETKGNLSIWEPLVSNKLRVFMKSGVNKPICLGFQKFTVQSLVNFWISGWTPTSPMKFGAQPGAEAACWENGYAKCKPWVKWVTKVTRFTRLVKWVSFFQN